MKKAAYLLTVLWLGACNLEKPIEIDELDTPHQLELHGFLSPQAGVEAFVAPVRPPFAADSPPIAEDVAVAVHRDGDFWTYLESTHPLHWQLPAGLAVEAGKRYHLEVTAANYPTLTTEAISLIPEVTLDSIAYLEATEVEFPSVFFQFQDPEGTENYYYWSEAVWAQGKIWDGWEPRPFVYWGIQEDKAWDGEQYTNRIYVVTAETDSVTFAFYHLGPQVYHYLDAMSKMDRDQGNPFTPPPLLPSNVTGGFGFFGALTYQDFLVKVFE